MSRPDPGELLGLAVAAAGAAAAMLAAGRPAGPKGRPEVAGTKSSPTDVVTEMDRAAEERIRARILAARPADAILGEEGGATGDGDLRWVVDPLDGTINFLFGIPAFAVSVACEDAAGAVAGVVLDPISGECFTATRSGPPALNGEPIQPGERTDLATALVGTGFNYDAGVRARQAAVVARVLPRVRDIRRVGAAALDLAWCACGRLDAFYERGVQPWDFAAGALIAERAGLVVRSLAATDEDPSGILVAPEAILEELLALVLG
jgi:myo-inositol-1(or 4)-monophosphatase